MQLSHSEDQTASGLKAEAAKAPNRQAPKEKSFTPKSNTLPSINATPHSS
jgi:hypothetical protein